MVELDPSGGEVTVGGVTLRTPGLSGRAEALPASLDGLRGPADDSAVLTHVLESEGMEPQEVVEIQDAFEEAVGFAATRTAHGEDAIEVDVPAPSAGYEQVVLYTDEAGVASWHVAGGISTEGVRGAGAIRSYRMARRVPNVVEGAGTRNLTGVAKKVIRVLTFDLGQSAVGWAADKIVDRWEAANRPYRFRTFSMDDKTDVGTTLDGEALRELSGAPSLLLIHGTGSTAAGGFGNMHPDLLGALSERYAGRIFAFDHPTVATAPDANVRELLHRLPGDDWNLDVVAHSRGGLVARTLIERAADFPDERPDRVRIGRVVFLAVPNAGTPLADMRHIQAYVDTITTLLNVLATGLPIAATLASVIAIVKQLAAGAVEGLDGLQSMHPTGSYLESLSGESQGTTYYAMASNYEPTAPGLVGFKDAVLDHVFGTDNDLVVPTAGVYELASARGSFPIAQPHRFHGAAGVDHSAFVRQEAAIGPLLTWLA